MPELKSFKIDGQKIVPLNRFNLSEGNLSTAVKNESLKDNNFTVIAHPIIHSININPVVIGILNKEYFPLVENNSSIQQTSILNDFTDNTIQLQFPEIEVNPYQNNQIFYYENVFDSSGKVSGLVSKVTMNYVIKYKATLPKLQNIKIALKEAILNLKVKNDVVKINGIINENESSITFNIKDEAVKIAFTNLITKIEELKSSIDLFFCFKGYTKIQKNFLLASLRFSDKMMLMDKPINVSRLEKSSAVAPMLEYRRAKIADKIDDKTLSKIENKDIVSDYVKSTFILKINKTVNFQLPSDVNQSFYHSTNGKFNTNPFNFNEDFSVFEQIFVPGISLDKLSIYKSKVSPNEFLLISKRYLICRDVESKKACISSVLHGSESDSGLSNDIAKVSFVFAIGPDLSQFDLHSIKQDLKNNNFLDGNSSINDIRFIYPNDLEAKYEINGNKIFEDANITTDGNSFIVEFETDQLNEASILINSINNSISLYANINFIHKEIKDTSIIEVNIQKTIGEVLSSEVNNAQKKVSIKNNSISSCKILNSLLIDETNFVTYSTQPFSNYSISSEGIGEVNYSNLNSNLSNKNLTNAFFDFDIIEDVSKEFNNIVATSSNFNRYVQIQIQAQKATTNKIRVELIVQATNASFTIEKLKSDFSKPILINFLLNGNSTNTIIGCTTKIYDKDNNELKSSNLSFDFALSSTITIPKQ